MGTENTITKADYPVRWRWLLKVFTPLLPIAMFVAFGVLFFAKFNILGDLSAKPTDEIITLLVEAFLVYYSFFILISFLFFISKFFIVINFHYAFENEFLVVRQGVVFLKQERHIPYGIIQNISVNQDLFDRLLDIATLEIETAAESAGWEPYERTESGLVVKSSPRTPPDIGFKYHYLVIPGLTKRDAESLKKIILQKMKEFPIKEVTSGL
jgi:membrane protein YdbS with pleckstrin-like domain